VKTLSDALQLTEAVLRFIIVKVPKTRPRPSPKEASVAAVSSTEEKASSTISTVTNLDSLSNEKLSQTLEEILK